MTLTFGELDSITNDFFIADGKKAVDNYFNDSYLVNLLMKQQIGLWERPDGGEKIRVPIEYDRQEGDFYARGETISSDDREAINAAYFNWKHIYSNATIRRIDGLKNAGVYAQVQIALERVSGAQKTQTIILSNSIYDDAGSGAKRLTGLLACCNETATTAFAGIQEADLVSSDGTKVWEGKRDTTATALTLPVIRTLVSDTKIRDGKGGKANVLVTTETLYNIVSDILQVQQRFKEATKVVDAGFTGLHFEGKDIVADDYCNSGYMFALNTEYIGFAVHRDGYFARTKWKVIPDSAEDKTMKIYWDGNLINSCRKGHKARGGLS